MCGIRYSWIVAGLLLAFGQAVYATEEAQQQKSEQPRQERPAEESKDGVKQPAKAPPVFVPTEEISADNAVSFPTDI